MIFYKCRMSPVQNRGAQRESPPLSLSTTGIKNTRRVLRVDHSLDSAVRNVSL
jgi:hypothetical protein